MNAHAAIGIVVWWGPYDLPWSVSGIVMTLDGRRYLILTRPDGSTCVAREDRVASNAFTAAGA
jgi:hypothetical protein